MKLYEKMAAHLEAASDKGLLRSIKSKAQKGSKIEIDGKEYINLTSNDYLGLGSDLALAKEFFDDISDRNIRMSSSGSPLLTGAHESYELASEVMSDLFHKRAVFFNSGFAANSGVIAALSDDDTLIIADKLSHASMIDGMNLGRGRFVRFAHNNIEHLKKLIDANCKSYDSIIVVTEAVFSMDGDRAPLKELAALKKTYDNVYLYVDEAHSFCLFNENGAGLCAKEGVTDDVDFILTTFGKGLGSQGACILCNDLACDYLINVCRSLIFSTALSPLSFAHNAFMVKKMQSFNDRRDRLHKICSYLHEAITSSGFENVSDSQIIPLVTGDNESALMASEFFKSRGFYAMPIRHPTVPSGRARLRLSVTASLLDSEVELLFNTIREFAVRKS